MQQSHSTKRKSIAKFITANWSTIIDRNDVSKDVKLFLATVAINRMVDDEVMAIFEPNKYQVFNGEYFKLCENGNRKGYYINYARPLNDGSCRMMHIAVWEYYNGKVPEGYVIHHKDFTKDNNDITNLQLMTRAEHTKVHKQREFELNGYVKGLHGK